MAHCLNEIDLQLSYLLFDCLDFEVGQMQLDFTVDKDVKVVTHVSLFEDDLVRLRVLEFHLLAYPQEILGRNL